MIEKNAVPLAGHLEIVLAGSIEEIVEVKPPLPRFGNEFLGLLAITFRGQKRTPATSKWIVGNLTKKRIHRRRFTAQAFQKLWIPITSH
jgi:hypothetical protein